jgi:hypothetical protein
MILRDCAPTSGLSPAAASPLFAPSTAQAEETQPATQAPLNGNGFYRFKVGEFQATVTSDGYGDIPVGPILAMNTPEAELAPVLGEYVLLHGRRPRKLKIHGHIRGVCGCFSWTLIEPCALRRSLILGESWKTFGRCSWPHRIKA